MSNYKISVIIPVYNAEKYLKECLESVINQTLKDIEIVLVNDGSKDNSLNIIKEYAEKYDNIKFIDQENKGVIGARITGYKNATGEYIGWVDCDDFIEPQMFETLYNAISKKQLDIAICNYEIYPRKPKKKKVWFLDYKGEINDKFLSTSPLLWNRLVKKELLDSIDAEKLFQSIGEGTYTIAMINTNKIVTINEVLYHYRVGHTSTSTNYRNINHYIRNATENERKLEYIMNSKFKEKWRGYFEYEAFYAILLTLIIAINTNNKKIYAEYKDKAKEYRNNQHVISILKENQGKIKTFVLTHLVARHYYLSMPVVKIFLRR